MKRVRLSPGPLTFGGGNATHAAPLQTEPTRTLRWKCASRYKHFHGVQCSKWEHLKAMLCELKGIQGLFVIVITRYQVNYA